MSPKPIIIAERFRFHKRDRKSDESVIDYIAQLRKLSEHCAFGAALDDTMRDRLVCGLRCEKTQKKLLSIDKLKLNKALEICVDMETATKDAAELENRHRNSTPVNKFKVTPKFTKKQRQKEAKCFHCGREGHEQKECYYRGAECRNCGGKGHIARACQSTSKKTNYSSGIKITESTFPRREH